jgi:hypothetical protein
LVELWSGLVGPVSPGAVNFIPDATNHGGQVMPELRAWIKNSGAF